MLLTFFISSSALSRAFTNRKKGLAEKFSKGSQRDWGQVLANGRVGAILAIVYAFSPHSEWLWLAFAGAMAAVNADTWSTELGVLSPVPPRLITSWKVVERGTSGGITLIGTLAATGGAALIGIAAIIFSPTPNWMAHLVIIILAGLVGSSFDSVLGASIQAIYGCPNCNKETEQIHVYGARARRTVSEEKPEFLNFDGDACNADHYHADEPIAKICDEFLADIREITSWLESLPLSAWSRLSRHEVYGEFTMQTWVERMLAHIDEHFQTIRKAG